MKHYKLLLSSVVLGISLFVMSGCGTPLPDTITYPPNNETSPSTSSEVTTPPTPTSTTSMDDDMSNWPVYKNETAGFELRYPTRLEQTSTNGSSSLLVLAFPKSDYQNTTLTDTKITLDVQKNSTSAKCLINYNNITAYLKNDTTNTNNASATKVAKDALTWYRSEFQDAGAGSLHNSVVYEMLNAAKCYRLTLGLASPLDLNSTKTGTPYNKQPFVDTFEKIVSTFKFIDSTTPSTTSTTARNQTITVTDNNKTITLQTKDTFLLKLGDETYNWTVQPNDFTVISRVKNVAVVKGAQGIYQADHPGETDLVALGEPLCLKEEPGCKMASLNFKLHIVVK